MKSKLRSVNTRFWDDTFICELSPKEKLLFLYLLTNPLTNLIGIYEVTIRRISFDTGLDTTTVQKGLERFGTFSKAFYVDNFIILPNFLKNQRLNRNMRIAVEREFDELPKELILKLFGNGSEPLPNGYETIWNALGMIRKKEKEIESESEGEKEKESKGEKEAETKEKFTLYMTGYLGTKGKSYDLLFEEFKKSCKKLGSSVEVELEKIPAAIQAYKANVEKQRAEGFKDLKYKNASTWLNNQCWLEEYEEVKPTVFKFDDL